MEIITSITNDPKQHFEIQLDNGELVYINLYFYPTQYAWYWDFQYKDYKCNGNKVVLSPNALRYLRNKIPFGIGFSGVSNADPIDLNSFKNKDVTMILLNQNDVEQTESAIYGNEISSSL